MKESYSKYLFLTRGYREVVNWFRYSFGQWISFGERLRSVAVLDGKRYVHLEK